MVETTTDYRRTFRVKCSVADAFAFFCDIPAVAGHFEGLAGVSPVSGGWLWALPKISVGPVSAEMSWALGYTFDEPASRIMWKPIAGGNSQCTGQWQLRAVGEGTEVQFSNRLVAPVDAPKIMRRAVQPVVDKQNKQMQDQWLANIERHLS